MFSKYLIVITSTFLLIANASYAKEKCESSSVFSFLETSEVVKQLHDRDIITCTTSSNGRSFIAKGTSLEIARDRVVNSCRSQYGSNIRECLRNVECDNQIPQPPIPPHNDSDLSGWCADYSHEQFMAARAFASSYSGLNLYASEATEWAMNYNRTHACGTIGVFKERFESLYNFAGSYSFLNLHSSEARAYALQRAERMDIRRIEKMKLSFPEVFQFGSSYSYLNLDSFSARTIAREWVERGYCGDNRLVNQMQENFQRHFQFASSYSGLNMDSSSARRYALDRVKFMTQCSDLF